MSEMLEELHSTAFCVIVFTSRFNYVVLLRVRERGEGSGHMNTLDRGVLMMRIKRPRI